MKILFLKTMFGSREWPLSRMCSFIKFLCVHLFFHTTWSHPYMLPFGSKTLEFKVVRQGTVPTISMPLTDISSLQHVPPVPVPPVAAKLLPPQPKVASVPCLYSVTHTTQPPQLASPKPKNQPRALLSVNNVPPANFSLAALTLTVSEPHSDVS